MIWFILSGWFAAGFVAGVAAYSIWAAIEDKPTKPPKSDSVTDNDNPFHWKRYKI